MPLKIASWNIRKAVGLDWRRDPMRVLAVLDRIAPDIALLQEADKRLAPRHPALPLHAVVAHGWRWIDADPKTPSMGHHGNAILIRKGIEVQKVAPLELPGLEPRGAILARIRVAGQTLTLGGLHLSLLRRDRVHQVRRITEAAAKLEDPVILGGDTNEWRNRADALPLPKGWQNIAPGASFHAAHPILALDRFLIGPGVEVKTGGVTDPAHARRASDHLPVWAEFEV